MNGVPTPSDCMLRAAFDEWLESPEGLPVAEMVIDIATTFHWRQEYAKKIREIKRAKTIQN